MSIQIPKRIDTRFRGGMAAVEEIDRRSLAAELRAAIEGEVRFDTGSRALYATDASNYRMPPIGVVVPRHVDELVEIHRVCREHDAPIVLRGGGTSLAGQGCNTAVLIDFSKYLHHILEIDPDRRLARVQPGCVLDHLRGVAAEKHGLTFGPDPSTHAYCTIGGMLGNNSCGRHSVQSEFHGPGPRMADNLVELEVLTYRGERLRIGPGGVGTPIEIADRLHALADANADEIRARYPQIPRRVSGYNLDELLPEKGFEVARSLVGTESTCVTVLEATLELIPKPKCVALLVVAYPDKYRTADHVMLARDHQPISIEGMDDTLIQDMTVLGIHEHERSQLPLGGGWLFVEFGGDTKDEADEKARALMRDLERDHVPPSGMKLYDDDSAEQHIWEVREAGLGATAFIPGKPDTYEGWEDSAVPPEHLGDYLRRLAKLGEKYGYESSLYGHYGQGCVHARWNFDLVTKPGIEKFRALARRGERSRARARRHALGRARRRSVEGRVPPEDVRRAAHRGVRGVQVDLGSRLEDESRQGRPAVPRRREPAPRRRLRPVASEGEVRVCEGSRRLRTRRRPLRRRGEVPHAGRRRRHVPVLHGDAGGDALDARPHAAPLRDAPG